MRIGLDYDHTYTADPDFWNEFYENAANAGHEVFIVTHRDPVIDRTIAIRHAETIIPVYYTCGVAKKFYMEHVAKVEPIDVWIDDRPLTIIENSKATHEELVEWRKTRQ